MVDLAWLPGLATHLESGKWNRWTACGMFAPHKRITVVTSEVTCLRCRRTKAYRAKREEEPLICAECQMPLGFSLMCPTCQETRP